MPWIRVFVFSLTVLSVIGVADAKGSDKPIFVQLAVVAPSDVETPMGLIDEIGAMVSSANVWLEKESGSRLRISRHDDGKPGLFMLRLESREADLRALGDGLPKYLSRQVESLVAKRDHLLVFIYTGRVNLVSRTHCGRRTGRYAGLYIRNEGCTHRFASGAGQGWDKIFLHEVFHALGAVGTCAPHEDGGHHVTDSTSDLMHRNGGGKRPRLDINRDDYFGHGRDDCLDLQRSALFYGSGQNRPQ